MPSQLNAPMIRLSSAAAIVAVACAAAHPASAQLPSASAVALGSGDNYTALARGYNAVAWNPAGLAMPGNPGFSLTILPVRGSGGLGPVTVSDVANFSGTTIPDDVKASWLERIAAAGGERGSADFDATHLAFSLGRMGVQVATGAHVASNISPDGAELLLYGNAGRTGEPRPFTLSGSTLDLTVTSTVGVSYAQPLPIRFGGAADQRFAVGATVKYTVGNAVMHAEDRGSVLQDSPLGANVDFPMVSSKADLSAWNNGTGVGLDLGASWQGGPLAAGLAVQDVFNTFAWDASRLYYRSGRALANLDSTTSDFDERPVAEAPVGLADAVTALRYHPALALGVAMRAGSRLTLSGDVRQHFGDGMNAEPKTHVGAGVEFRPIGLLPLRAGAAAITGGYQLSGGFGLQLGWFNLSASAARRRSDLNDGVIGAFALSFGTR